MLTNDQKSMDKIVNLCKSRGLYTRALRSTAVWQTPGTTALWVWN